MKTKRYPVELSLAELQAAMAAAVFWEASDGLKGSGPAQARAAERFRQAIIAARPEVTGGRDGNG